MPTYNNGYGIEPTIVLASRNSGFSNTQQSTRMAQTEINKSDHIQTAVRTDSRVAVRGRNIQTSRRR
jgi:hypothetical protein